MKSLSLLVCVTALLLGFSTGHASPKAPPEPKAPEVEVKGPSPATLEQIFNQAAGEIKVVEGFIASGQYGPAELAAKNIFDRVSIIHPKANFRQKIAVNGILTDIDLAKDFSQLSNTQKENLAIAIADYKGGFYLDLLNLGKRAKLLYLKAVYFQMRDNLRERDIDMIKNSLIEIHNIVILVADKKTSDAFMLFDVDVANRDQQYFFNRELLEFAVQVKELNLTEKGFDQLLREDRALKLKEYHQGLRGVNVPQVSQGLMEFSKCIRLFYNYTNYESTRVSFCQNFSEAKVYKVVNCLAAAYNYTAYESVRNAACIQQADRELAAGK